MNWAWTCVYAIRVVYGSFATNVWQRVRVCYQLLSDSSRCCSFYLCVVNEIVFWFASLLISILLCLYRKSLCKHFDGKVNLNVSRIPRTEWCGKVSTEIDRRVLPVNLSPLDSSNRISIQSKYDAEEREEDDEDEEKNKQFLAVLIRLFPNELDFSFLFFSILCACACSIHQCCLSVDVATVGRCCCCWMCIQDRIECALDFLKRMRNASIALKHTNTHGTRVPNSK